MAWAPPPTASHWDSLAAPPAAPPPPPLLAWPAPPPRSAAADVDAKIASDDASVSDLGDLLLGEAAYKPQPAARPLRRLCALRG